jgi:hypothetical protein
MAIPKVTIKYLNGLLGIAPESQDGLLALVVLGATGAGDTFKLGTPYKVYGPSSLVALGITEDNNARLVELVREFYSECNEGTPLYIVGIASGTMTSFCNKDTGKIVSLVESLKGELRGVMIANSAAAGEVKEGIAADVLSAAPIAQVAAEHCANVLYAPIFVILEGKGYQSTASLQDLSEKTYNRVGIVIGDTKADSDDAAIGILAGKIAASPIQRNIGAVLDGPLTPVEMYLGNDTIDNSMDDVRTAHDKGYIVPRIHVGRSGYFYCDDPMACDPTDDYGHLTARRTIDKAARIAYDTLLDYLLSEIELNEDGTMQQPVVKSWQAAVESAINTQMTSRGELSATNGSGCRCIIDATQNVLATSTINVVLKVRPYGYAREIVCEIGFLTANV